MDIIVTTPKGEIKNSAKEANLPPGGYWFRAFPTKPNVEPGDKIYFVENGYIRGYGIIFKREQGKEQRSETTGRIWKGKWFVGYRDWHWLENPIQMKGFQGYRYMKNVLTQWN